MIVHRSETRSDGREERRVTLSRSRALRRFAVLVTPLLLAACGDGEDAADRLPSPAELEGLYGSRATVRLNGNVVDIVARQERDQLVRGGPLWARVGPYIFLFSPQTREIFDRYPGVAAVRVRTVTGNDRWVAEAMLLRDELNGITWRDAVRRVARARNRGTERPSYIEELVDYGEDHTEFRYNPRFTDGG